MKNLVISLTKEGKRSVYISVQKRPELLAPLAHKLRVKSALYECLVSTYHPEMDFTHTLNNGWIIEEDNRASYIHNIKIVPAYSRKKKENKNCPLCGQEVKNKKKQSLPN